MFLICFIFYIVSDTETGGYAYQQVTVTGYYIALHISFLLLHNALGKKNEFDGSHKHFGITLILTYGLIALMCIFLIFVLAVVIV